MNITNLIIQLQSKINDSTYDQLAVSKSIELLKTGQVNYVNAYSDLPAASVSNGYMYYIAGSGLYYSNGTIWNRMVPVENYTYIWSWGCNGYGRLGDNNTTPSQRSSPVPVGDQSAGWLQVAAGAAHSLAVKQNGTAWAWGRNNYGQLSDNTCTTRSSPVLVVGGFTDWCQIAAGTCHSVAVRTNGTAWSWGYNGSGRLGDNTTVRKSSPVSVVGGITDWCQVAAGHAHSLGVRQNGTAWGWGNNGYGRLGDGTSTTRSSPVSVVGGFTDWCQISTSNRSCHSLAIRTNGTLWAWGRNNVCQLGDGSSTARASPVSVICGFTDWCQVSAGYEHSLAVRQNGTARAWGCASSGKLGTNNCSNNYSGPKEICGGFTDWCQVTAGTQHSLGVKQNGTLWGWGAGSEGKLGSGDTNNFASPKLVGGGFTDWCQVSTGQYHTLAIRAVLD
jgi:alpha-tubulin suppressor-like RCC1 family protein